MIIKFHLVKTVLANSTSRPTSKIFISNKPNKGLKGWIMFKNAVVEGEHENICNLHLSSFDKRDSFINNKSGLKNNTSGTKSRNSKYNITKGNSFWNNGSISSAAMIPTTKNCKPSQKRSKAILRPGTILKSSYSKIVKPNSRVKSKNKNT